MSIALIVLAALLGVAAFGSGVQKFRRDPRIVESMHSVGVGDRQIPVLAALELLGALGLLVGIWIAPIGMAAAVCLAIYFFGAVIAHIRAKQPIKDAVPAIALMLIAIVTAILEFTR